MAPSSSQLTLACEALGVHADPSSALGELRGRVDGVTVTLSGAWETRSQAQLKITAQLPHGADLGLAVFLTPAFRLASPTVTTGDGAFDGIFSVGAAPDEVEHVLALLDAPLRARLRALAAIGYPELTDSAFTCTVDHFAASHHELVDRVRRCASLAAVVDARAATLPPPQPLRSTGLSAAFERAAAERGLRYRTNAMSAEGSLATAAVSVRWRAWRPRHGPLHLTRSSVETGYVVRARFHEPLGLGLSLRPASLADRAKDLVGLGDLRLDDAPFDAAWAIRARDVDGARASLHPNARAHLQRLAAAGMTLTLDDEGFEGHAPIPTSPDAAPEVLRLVEDLRDALRPHTTAGPYR